MSISSRACLRSSKQASVPGFLNRGFTLVEMLMVVAIICIITLVLFVRQQAFDSSTLLRSLAYSVALTFEQAQTYNVGARGFTSSGATQFVPGYGVYFESSALGSYAVFADTNGNHCRTGDYACLGSYSSPPAPGMGSEDLPAYYLSTGYKIKDVCGIWSSNSSIRSCLVSPQGAGTLLTSLTVYFKRPDPDAYFYSSTASGATGENYSAVYVQLWAGGDATNIRTVKITPTGEVTVCALNADPGSC